MSRSYWRIILAALGCLIVAASPPRQTGNSEQAQTDNRIANSLDRLATTLQNSAESAVPNQPCENGGEASHSDLCAQWKAANAAEAGANASWLFGALGCLIGGATLIAAIMAAKYAKEAAAHTKTGAEAADRSLEISRSGLRAHILSDHESVEWNATNGELKILIALKNCGATAAYDFYTVIHTFFVADGAEPLKLRFHDYSPQTLAATQIASYPFPAPVDNHDMNQVLAGTALVRIEVNSTYTDAFGEPWNFYLKLKIDQEAMGSAGPLTEDSQHTRRSGGAKTDADEQQPKLL